MTEPPTAAFVTGGSGFIGGRLVRRLVAEGWKVHALARSGGSAADLQAMGATPVRGDLADVDGMAAGVAGCTVAFHLAAHLGQWGPREDFERGNVTGTENALEACARASVARFVHCGTEAALLAGEPLVDVDETAPLRPDSKAHYPATKALDGEPVVFREFVSDLLTSQGVEPPTRSLPSWIARIAVTGSELAWRGLRLAGASPLTRLAFWLSAHECTIDISKARRQLAYEPVKSRHDGLGELRAAASGP